ncbi:PREDICTED: uncharacterized protein LOC107339748 isoform X1 [Acropora digitifera]|uniref:uncharacterized protein LOC107339748 isoform X1 n=1 Tax=Acropora digitifera TaxID=70779 RepID=UPI00077AEC7A|nr:PREDICTED: uncharacterized protein LOC107339748 isoform X1 [Acropora digitifera]
MKRIWPLAVTIFFMWNLYTGYADGSKGKPARIVIPSQVIRTVPEHYVWCSSDGTPPINMSLIDSSAILAESVGTTVMSRILIDGNYTCHATNEFGTDSKTFHVSLIASGICSSCYCGYTTYRSPFGNLVICYGKSITTRSLTNIPTTTTDL